MNLKNLTTLNLFGNHIQEWPDLQGCSKIEYLNLNANEIKAIWLDNSEISYFKTLKTLDFGSNLIDLQDDKHLDQFLGSIRLFVVLRDLVIEENPFLDENNYSKFNGINPKNEFA